MIDEYLETQAALYVAGAMTVPERDEFELVLEFHQELRKLVTELAELGAMMAVSQCSGIEARPSPGLQGRIDALIATRPQLTAAEGLVMAGPDRRVRWVNPAFSEMCGYTLDELQGRSLGPILQGPGTDRETAGRMRAAVQQFTPCRETILNYHKNGAPYWVDVEITPISDDAGRPLWLLARERERTDLPVA